MGAPLQTTTSVCSAPGPSTLQAWLDAVADHCSSICHLQEGCEIRGFAQGLQFESGRPHRVLLKGCALHSNYHNIERVPEPGESNYQPAAGDRGQARIELQGCYAPGAEHEVDVWEATAASAAAALGRQPGTLPALQPPTAAAPTVAGDGSYAKVEALKKAGGPAEASTSRMRGSKAGGSVSEAASMGSPKPKSSDSSSQTLPVSPARHSLDSRWEPMVA